jgi:hypothetical protein
MTDLPWLPNFLIPGAPKAGTSSLQRWIADHPDAFGSTEKETYFLVDPDTHMHMPDFHISQGLETWQAQFPIPADQQPKIIVESTPGYIYYKIALDTVPDLPSQPKCLFVLREPGSQILSLYTYFRDNWDWIPSDMSFAAFIEAARAGTHDFKGNELARNALAYARYIDFLEPWADRLGPDRIMVTTFDALKADGPALTLRIAEWLGLEPGFYESYDFPRENETYAPKNRALQSLNVKIRGSLPKGRAYDLARGLYRRLNTVKGRAPKTTDKELAAELGKDFTEANRRLAARFDLDLSGWPT